MASAPASGQLDAQCLAVIKEFAARHYPASGAQRFGIPTEGLAAILAEVVGRWNAAPDEPQVSEFLSSLRLEELVLARACVAGNDSAWEIFLTRYRDTLFESAHKIAPNEDTARELAGSLYSELYGLSAKGEERISKLRYYHGRGSLQGWLGTVLAQEYVNRYRSMRREISLDAVLDGGKQFAAKEPEQATADPRIAVAVTTELEALPAEERFLLAAYYLDRHTLAEIARLLRVHESTISRKLERTTAGLRKRILKRMIDLGMSARQADEAMQEVDVRDLPVNVEQTLRQETPDSAFYRGKSRGDG